VQQERLVAVKLFHLDLAPARLPELVAGFQRLIDAKLVHPAVATPIATGVVGTSAYLAQDFVAADSLEIVIREFGPVPPDEAARVALQLAGALDFAAAANIWHGTLHPQDIFLASDDIKLTGLGVAQALEHVRVPPTLRRPYSAPERIAGGPWDRRADVYGLAVVIAEMIAGRRLSESGPRAVQGLLGSAGVNADTMRAVFARALADDPNVRFATALAFVKALRQATRGAVKQAAAPRVLLRETVVEPRLPLADPVAFVPELTAAGDPLSDFDLATSLPVPEIADRAPSPPILEADVLRDFDAALRVDDEDVKERIKEVDTLMLHPALAPRVEAAVPDTHETNAIGAADAAVAPAASGDAATRAAAVVAEAPLKRPAPFAPAARRPVESRSQSAVWPIALALLVGLIVGVAVGFYVFGDRAGRGVDVPTQADNSVSPERSVAPPPPPAPAPAPEPSPSSAATPAAVPDRPTDRPAAIRPDRQVPPATPAAEIPAPAPPPEAGGRVLVRSSPAGARVVLDGKEVGITPVTVRALAFGTHTVRVSRDGYVDDERRVAISARRPAQSLIVELARVGQNRSDAGEAPARFTAALVIESRPPGAIVFLNGARVGTTPLTLASVATGSQALRLELDGYRRWTSSIRVVAGERNRITASLEQ
jgi:serine/threonine-protein kinase